MIKTYANQKIQVSGQKNHFIRPTLKQAKFLFHIVKLNYFKNQRKRKKVNKRIIMMKKKKNTAVKVKVKVKAKVIIVNQRMTVMQLITVITVIKTIKIKTKTMMKVKTSLQYYSLTTPFPNYLTSLKKKKNTCSMLTFI